MIKDVIQELEGFLLIGRQIFDAHYDGKWTENICARQFVSGGCEPWEVRIISIHFFEKVLAP